MSTMVEPTVTVCLDVPAAADTVYGWLTDLDTFATFTEENQAMRWTSGRSAARGAVFRGRNRNGWRRWSTTCTVTDAEPGRRFGFEVTSFPRIPVARWEYRLEPTGEASCRVTESTWDRRPAWFRKPAALATGVSDRDTASREHIEATLARLRRYAEAH